MEIGQNYIRHNCVAPKLSERLTVKQKIIVLAIVAVLLVSSVVTVLAASGIFSPKNEQFYVGVTYCGDNTTYAELLIDKVKNYTNLFVLDSGPLQYNTSAINEIGDYAVNAGLHYMIYFGEGSASSIQYWNESYDGRWNSSFLGIYFGDEPGGKMLDSERQFYDPVLGNLMKYANGDLQWVIGNGSDYSEVRCANDGRMTLRETHYNNISENVTQTLYLTIIYYPNRTITQTTRTVTDNLARVTRLGYASHQVISTTSSPDVTTIVTDNSTIEYSYNALWNLLPIKNDTQAKDWFIRGTNLPMDRYRLQNATYLTSDYGLYWYDYLAGYDTVLAQLGWNHTTTQDIGLVRGAANLQNKTWGTIITWKYMQEPYLASGQEIYDQMKLSYECGATYVLIFNYAQNMTGPYGTLKDEHFAALQRFWKDVVKSPFEHQGQAKADAAYVLPQNYGSGLRSQNDTVWGLLQPTDNYMQIWPNLQNALKIHGDKLDIVYDDPAHPARGNYSKVIFWNQTK